MADQGDASKPDAKELIINRVINGATHVIVSVGYAEDTLLAGTDGGTLLLWGKEHLEGGPQSTLSLDSPDSVNCICYITKCQWIVGCGEAAIIVGQSSNQLSKTQAISVSEEVNSIDVNEKFTYAAVADDSGVVTTIDLKTCKVHKRLKNHDNICSCVRFRPKSPWHLVSSGLDCVLTLWNYNKGQVLGSVSMADIESKAEEKSSYVVNPPLIHSLALSSDGLIAAAGLENGKIYLFTIGGEGFKMASTLDVHHQGVSSLHITADMRLVSAANDQQLNVWTLSTARAPGKTLIWATLVASITHPGKPSCTAAIASQDLFAVADETENLHLYKL